MQHPGDVVLPTEEQMVPIQALMNRHLWRQAYEAAIELGPLRQWRGRDAVLMAARIAGNVGDDHLWAALLRFAHLQYRNDPAVSVRTLELFSQTLGPVHMLRRYWRDPQGPLPTDPDITTRWLEHYVREFGTLRDLETAEKLAREATSLVPDMPYAMVSFANALGVADLHEQALEVVAPYAAMTEHGVYPYAAHTYAQILSNLQRDDEALAVLQEASKRTEYFRLNSTMAHLLSAVGRFEEVPSACQDVFRNAPLLSKESAEFIYAIESTAYREIGRRRDAVAVLRKSERPYMQAIADRMENNGDRAGRRLRLPVEFVLQNQMTCAPATLAMIGQYWMREVQHLRVADEICYEGTPNHRIVHWLRSNGWVLRIFTPNWDVVTKLLDRALPLMVLTQESDSGHAQAIIGYDEECETFLIQDPSLKHYREVEAKSFLESYQETQLRCIVFVPAEREESLNGIEYPDCELHECLQEVEAALFVHDRVAAVATVDRMLSVEPSHPLTYIAQSTVAAYDGNTARQLELLEKLMETFAAAQRLPYRRLVLLLQMSRSVEALDYARHLVSQDTVDPAVLDVYISMIQPDIRRRDEVESRLGILGRYRARTRGFWQRAASISLLNGEANLYREFSRISLCLETTSESSAEQFFDAARATGQTDVALKSLRWRFDQFGKKSPYPAITLADALCQCNRPHEVEPLLHSASELLPNNAQLSLYKAKHFASLQRADDVEHALAAASGQCSRLEWLWGAAQAWEQLGQLDRALEAYTEILTCNPLSSVAVTKKAEILTESVSWAAACACIREHSEAYPFHQTLRRHAVQYTESHEERLQLCTRYCEDYPDDAWGMRELAYAHILQRNWAAAHTALDNAERIEPNSEAGLILRCQLYYEQGEYAKAGDAARQCLMLSVDNPDAIQLWWSSTATRQQELDMLESTFGMIRDQVTNGQALSAWVGIAARNLDRADLLERLREANEARPDLPATWIQRAQQLNEAGEHVSAHTLMQDALTHFPLNADVQYVTAVLNERQQGTPPLADYRKAWEMKPRSVDFAHAYADALRRADCQAEGIEFLESLVSLRRSSNKLELLMASLYWLLDDTERAVQLLESRLSITPADFECWSKYFEWQGILKQRSTAVEFARRTTEAYPANANMWLSIARVLTNEEYEFKLHAVLKAKELCSYSEFSVAMLSRLLHGLNKPDMAHSLLQEGLRRQPTVTLRLTEAQLTYYSGNRAEGVRLLEAVTREWPRDRESRDVLVDWYLQAQQFDEALATAEDLVRIAPQESYAHHALARTHMYRQELNDANEHLIAAAELSGYAVEYVDSLMHFFLDTERPDAAIEAGQRVPENQASKQLLLLMVKAQAKVASTTAALKYLEVLIDRCEVSDASLLYDAASAMFESAQGDACAERLTRILIQEADDPRPSVVTLWYDAHYRLQRTSASVSTITIFSILEKLPHTHGAAMAAAIADVFPRQYSRPNLMDLLRDRESELYWNGVLFRSMASALYNAGWNHEFFLWMAGVEHRPDEQMWVVALYVERLLEIKRASDAFAAAARALENCTPDHTNGFIAAMAAIYYLSTAQVDKARSVWTQVEQSAPFEMFNPYVELAQLYVLTSLAAKHDRRQVYMQHVGVLQTSDRRRRRSLAHLARFCERRASWIGGSIWNVFRAYIELV